MNRLLLAGICLTFYLIGLNPLLGQSRIYVGVESAVFEDQNNIGEDAGGGLNTVPTKGLLAGLNIRKDLHSKWFIESGVFFKRFYQSIVFDLPVNYPYTLYAFMSLQVPFRLGYKIRLLDRVSLIPQPSISMGYNIEPFNNGFGGSTIINGTTYTYSAQGTHEQRFFILLNPSLVLEAELSNSLTLSIYAGGSWGYNDLSELIVDYTINNSSTYRGTIINQGKFYYGGISLRYPIGKSEKKS